MRVARHIRRLSTTVTLTVAALTILGSGIAAAQTPGADVAPRGGPTMSSADDVACLQLADAQTNDICPCVIPALPAAPADFMPTAPLPTDVDVNSLPSATVIVSGDCR
ncbi:hypothetical protein ABIA65_001078 [Mycolicibacterium sp. 624]